MKRLDQIIVVIEIFLIVIMSIIAAYSLFGTNIWGYLLGFGLILIGVLTIVWKNRRPEIFSSLVILSAICCLFQHNRVDLLADFNNGSLPGISTTLIEACGLGLVTVLGYLMLKLLNNIQIEHKSLVDGQAEKEEIRSVTRDKMMAAAIFVFLSGMISIPVILLSNGLMVGISNALSGFSGNIVAIGLGIMLLLASCLYWLGRTLRS
jgi:hypothetical protein